MFSVLFVQKLQLESKIKELEFRYFQTKRDIANNITKKTTNSDILKTELENLEKIKVRDGKVLKNINFDLILVSCAIRSQ